MLLLQSVFCVCFVALQPQLVPLLGKLPDQQESIYQLLANLEQKACFIKSALMKLNAFQLLINSELNI